MNKIKNMLKLKQHINNNKQLLIIFFGMLGFLFLHNLAYCDLSFFQKWYQNTENYFLTLTWEKAISDPIELSKSVGWVSVGAIGSLYAFEGIWNIRRLGSIVLYRYTPFGHLDDGSGFVKSWFGFRNTAGPLKNIIDTVPYEEILPLHLARNYVFPYIFIPVNPNRVNTIQIDPNTNSRAETTTNSLAIRPSVPEITSVNNVEPQVVERIREVNHYFEVPVYINKYVPVVEYRDRENLTSLEGHINLLTQIGRDLLFLQNQANTREDIIKEVLSLRDHENAVCLKIHDLKKAYDSFSMSSVTEEYAYSFSPMKIQSIEYSTYYNKFQFFFGEVGARVHVSLTPDVFKEKYPSIYKVFMALKEEIGNEHSKLPIIELKYVDQRTLFSSSFSVDALGSVFKYESNNCTIPLISKIEEILINSLDITTNEFNALALNIQEKYLTERRLININTQEEGVQTVYFDLNETIFDRINTYLDIRDETSFIVASHEGRNLPFNNMQIQSYSKPQETTAIQTQETSVETQTEPSISENVGILGMSSVNSSIFQNMATLFSVVLVGSIAYDSHTVELIAKSLLGFTHIPEYNQAFLAATHMSVADLQMEYGFSLDDARRAYDAIGQAYDIRHPGSSLSDISSNLSNSNDYLDQAQKASNSWGWKDYLLVTGGAIIAVGSLYYIFQSFKTGTPVDSVQNISPSVETWKNAYFDKINKL